MPYLGLNRSVLADDEPTHAYFRSTAATIACASCTGLVNGGQWPVGRSTYSTSRKAASSATYG